MSTIRAFGKPSESTVASVMALGSAGSDRVASENQAARRRKGSSASVKSPLVNPLGCCIDADSDISEFQVIAGVPSRVTRRVSVPRYNMHSYRGCPTARLWRALGAATCTFTLALSVGGCSFSYQLDNLFAQKDGTSLNRTLQEPAPPALHPVAQ